MVKRIILLLDGTWNDIDAGPKDTNIVRMRGLISRHLVRVSSHGHSGDDGGDKKVHGYTKSGKEHIVYYERGVGTGAFDQFRGGAFGEGLTQNIRHAYKFLSFWYEPGDEIFIYGFSRGAYTARSLVGYLGSAGLLLRDNCNEELEALAWRYYRTPPNDRTPADWRRLTDNAHDRNELRVKLLGVFDTVGCLGIPASIAWRLNRNENGFHDVELSSITDVNLHAVAIDEHRWPFQATLWRQPPFKKSDAKVEQVWFSGAHSDVGGGYIEEETRDPKAPYADDVTLDWMIKRTKHFYPDFPFDLDSGAKEITDWNNAKLHNSRSVVYMPGGSPFDPSPMSRSVRAFTRKSCRATGTPTLSAKKSIFPPFNACCRTGRTLRRRSHTSRRTWRVSSRRSKRPTGKPQMELGSLARTANRVSSCRSLIGTGAKYRSTALGPSSFCNCSRDARGT